MLLRHALRRLSCSRPPAPLGSRNRQPSCCADVALALAGRLFASFRGKELAALELRLNAFDVSFEFGNLSLEPEHCHLEQFSSIHLLQYGPKQKRLRMYHTIMHLLILLMFLLAAVSSSQQPQTTRPAEPPPIILKVEMPPTDPCMRLIEIVVPGIVGAGLALLGVWLTNRTNERTNTANRLHQQELERIKDQLAAEAKSRDNRWEFRNSVYVNLLSGVEEFLSSTAQVGDFVVKKQPIPTALNERVFEPSCGDFTMSAGTDGSLMVNEIQHFLL